MKTKKPFSWSYSKYSCYKKCPQQYYRKYILKLPEPPAPALIRGIDIHEKGEAYLLGKLKQVPEEYNGFAIDMKYIKSRGATPEEQYCFNKKWKVTGWFDKDAWLRLKIDVMLELNKSGSRVKLTDFKTGKVRKGEYHEQLDLYATAKFAAVPKIKEIVNDLWFLDYDEILDSDNDKTIKEVYLRKDAASMRASWERRVKPMQNDTVFAVKKSFLCNGWCTWCKQNGGNCL